MVSSSTKKTYKSMVLSFMNPESVLGPTFIFFVVHSWTGYNIREVIDNRKV